MSMEDELTIAKAEEIIKRMPLAERQAFREKLNKAGIPTKKKTKIEFPEIEISFMNKVRMCISKKSALNHLGEFLLNDLDKMSSSTIKAHAVEALATLSELEDNISGRKDTLMRAANIVMEVDRSRLMGKIATLAVLT